MNIKLLTKHHLELLSKKEDKESSLGQRTRGVSKRLHFVKGGCTIKSEATLVIIPHCWKSHLAAQMSSAVYHQFVL